MHDDDHTHDWTSPTKAAARAEMDRFRNLGLKNYKLGCRCEPCQKLVTSKKKYTAGVDLVGDRCVWTCTCPGGREPQRRTKRRKKGAAALPASAAAAPARVEEATAAVPAVQAQQQWRLLAVLAEEATNPAPAEGVASFAVLAPVAAAAVPTPLEQVGSSVAMKDSEEADATGPPWQQNRLTLATLGSGRFD